MLARDKRSSLFSKVATYGRKNFYNIAPGLHSGILYLALLARMILGHMCTLVVNDHNYKLQQKITDYQCKMFYSLSLGKKPNLNSELPYLFMR
jgi:hypothetical protein